MFDINENFKPDLHANFRANNSANSISLFTFVKT